MQKNCSGRRSINNNCSCSMTISAKTEYIHGIVDKIIVFFHSYIYLTEEAEFEIKVILNELLINAIKHGSQEDEQKKVYIKAGICKENNIYIIVQDQGEGIGEVVDYCKEISDEESEADVFCFNESGRGLMIISSLCDHLKTNKKGNKIVVVKKI